MSVIVSMALAVLSLIFPPACANTVINTCSCKVHQKLFDSYRLSRLEILKLQDIVYYKSQNLKEWSQTNKGSETGGGKAPPLASAQGLEHLI